MKEKGFSGYGNGNGTGIVGNVMNQKVSLHHAGVGNVKRT